MVEPGGLSREDNSAPFVSFMDYLGLRVLTCGAVSGRAIKPTPTRRVLSVTTVNAR